jgi:hypothetical protein
VYEISLVLLSVNLVLVILSTLIVPAGPSQGQIIRFGICIGLCVLMCSGHSWARWLVVVLYIGSGLGASLTGISMLPENLAGLNLLAVGFIYFVSISILAFSKAVREFFVFKKPGIPLTKEPDESPATTQFDQNALP